jgi:protein-L-isoaspartate(D-aspartate) O-methyltransferase
MTFDFAAARDIMVDSQVRPGDVPNMALQSAMRAAPRESLCPPAKASLAYAEAEIEYAPGRFLLRPRHVAKLLFALAPKSGERALAIAAPYAAMVLEAMGLTVTQLDGDDLKTPPVGHFDVIVCEGAVSETPAAWLGALAPEGRLAVIVRQGPVGKARLYLRSAGDLGWREIFDATPPILPGFAAQPGFVF